MFQTIHTNRIGLTVLFVVTLLCASFAQQGNSRWCVLIGAQASYAFEEEPAFRVETADGFLSGYSPAYGLGAVSSLSYTISPGFTISATFGADVHRFSYDLVSPPTFGEIDGRIVPGRNLTEYKGVGVTGITELGTSIGLGSNSWSPVLILRAGIRSWLMEHSNAAEASDAGFQRTEDRDDARNQAYFGAGFGVSPFSKNNQLSLVYQRTLEPFEPLHHMLVLRQLFTLSKGQKGVKCPTF